MTDEDQVVHAVRFDAGRFSVLNESGRVIVICRDEHSANEYAVLLNEAYARGFKAGSRQARRATARDGPANRTESGS
jgi:hypothetical protein